jgi:hypothetical protein
MTEKAAFAAAATLNWLSAMVAAGLAQKRLTLLRSRCGTRRRKSNAPKAVLVQQAAAAKAAGRPQAGSAKVRAALRVLQGGHQGR